MSTSGSSPEPARRVSSRVVKAASLLAILPLSAVVFWLGSTLWGEWKALRADWDVDRAAAPVGYVNIYPRRSFAEKPTDWFHDDSDGVRLWSGWTPGVGHGWFRVGPGEIDRERLTNPLGRDVIPAIDLPIVEVGDGDRWRRIPTSAMVAGLKADGVSSAYPVLLLEKVEVVNDRIKGRPYLVTYSPLGRDRGDIDVYNPDLEGRRMVLGLTGYFYDTKPLLYDRETESLWTSLPDGLTAIAGKLKGSRLSRLGRPTPVAWEEWKSGNPEGRLIVGSNRATR